MTSSSLSENLPKPTLEQLISDAPTTYVFGAGASADYGFPLWGGLKVKFHECLATEEFRNHPACKLLLGCINEQAAKDKSIDLLVFEASKQNREVVTLFAEVCAKILLEVERAQVDGGWLRIFAQKYRTHFSKLDRLRDIQFVMENTNFITLNYERSFEHIFFNHLSIHDCMTRFLVNGEDAEVLVSGLGKDFMEIIHPHGSIGNLNSSLSQQSGSSHSRTNIGSSAQFISYGNVDKKFDPKKSSMMVVDQANDGLNPSYELANDALANSLAIVCVGLSVKGLGDSRLEFPDDVPVHFWSPHENCPFDGFVTHRGNAIDFAESL